MCQNVLFVASAWKLYHGKSREENAYVTWYFYISSLTYSKLNRVPFSVIVVLGTLK